MAVEATTNVVAPSGGLGDGLARVGWLAATKNAERERRADFFSLEERSLRLSSSAGTRDPKSWRSRKVSSGEATPRKETAETTLRENLCVLDRQWRIRNAHSAPLLLVFSTRKIGRTKGEGARTAPVAVVVEEAKRLSPWPGGR